MAFEQPQQEEPKTIPLTIFIDKENNKVVAVESTKDFIDTLFSFLSLPLATIIHLLSNNNNDQQQESSESSPFPGNIKNLYESVQTLAPNDVWNNPVCKQMLLNPKNPCEETKLSFPLDDLEVKVISIGEAEALSLLAASLTSKSTLTSGLEEFLNMPKQDSNLTSKCVQTSRHDKVAKKPKLVH
ncbi:DUF674 family protein [Medicago truncatula]|uniref:DUF674 family protein n=1 Tax=Medicago truncatula TaxID=3880 RepID=G7JS87_MEDTR|nr:DUF674 family protein [Medicago truncatula]